MIHLVINILLVLLIIVLWLGNRKIEKEENKPVPYDVLLNKLKVILDSSEYEIFQIAAMEKGHADYKVPVDFDTYIKTERIPVYVQQFLEEGRETILETKISKWFL